MCKSIPPLQPLKLLETEKRCKPNRDTIRVGVSGNLGGHTRELCTGFALAVEDWMATFPSFSVEVIWQEDQLDESAPGLAADCLIQQQVHAVIGHLSSTEALKAVKRYQEKQIAFLAPATSHPMLTYPMYKHVLRFYGRDEGLANRMVCFVSQSLGAKRVLIIKEGIQYGQSLSALLQHRLKQIGVQDVQETVWDGDPIDISEDIEAILYAGRYQVGSQVLRWLNQQKVTKPVIMGDDAYIAELPILAGEAGEKTYVVSTDHDPLHPDFPAFLQRYQSRAGLKPGAYSITSYLATKLYLKAAAEVGAENTHAVISRISLNAMHNHSLMGKLLFDSHGNWMNFPWAVYQIRNGEFVKLK
ncbi:branched-chain amino acid ABC transporter substrate-binding protein [Melghirimyces algeriensis]|uniref:ABC-type branched-chain amino acid transport system, substrate-binding protein n=1 Tax=Melghirimyces algeriensis TaxID=910412 RepID=A0A521D5J8_9BACL|nr:branched-chain amino acid ABC transporter substrate-binding protein [Melghirimyces algeriensis]SMO66882.1 ABC-type branched-chain amino acid transport system, substrate-binding protein [Melghirimyces algeriensis]